MKQSGFALILIVLFIAAAVGGYFVYSSLRGTGEAGNVAISLPASSIPKSESTSSAETANWKTFTSKMEGFTLHYPPDWTVEDTSSGNCGHKSGIASPIGFCRDRFSFKSPDGLRVGYVVSSDESKDRYGCGIQNCAPNVKNLETLNIPTLGQVYLVAYTTDYAGQYNHIALHKPSDAGTIPILGENKHSGYDISFSLPSKTGGRFIIDVFTNTEDNQSSKWYGMSYEEFYNSDSVQKAIKILKSLSY